MRRRLRRASWWIRRFRGWRFAAFVLTIATAGAAGWFLAGSDSAAVGGGVALAIALVLVGMGLALPMRGLLRRMFLRTAPWRTRSGPLSFAGADLGFRVVGLGVGLGPREVVDAITASGGRFFTGEVSVELWLVATDRQGQDWIIAQEARETLGGPVVWTSTIDGATTMADFDGSGRVNPFRAAHRLVKEELDVPIVDIEVLGWGTEEGVRDAVVAVARTSHPAEKLSGMEYAGDRYLRSAHLVALDIDGVAKTLGWGHPVNWRGGSAFGLLELLEIFQPGAWAALERRVAPRWQENGMFVRVERGTARLTERAGIA